VEVIVVGIKEVVVNTLGLQELADSVDVIVVGIKDVNIPLLQEDDVQSWVTVKVLTLPAQLADEQLGVTVGGGQLDSKHELLMLVVTVTVKGEQESPDWHGSVVVTLLRVIEVMVEIRAVVTVAVKGGQEPPDWHGSVVVTLLRAVEVMVEILAVAHHKWVFTYI
jgi:hypothetical protein